MLLKEEGRPPGTAAEKQVQAELVLLELAEVPDTASPGFGSRCTACWMFPIALWTVALKIIYLSWMSDLIQIGSTHCRHVYLGLL